MAKASPKKTDTSRNYQNILTGLTILLFVQTPFVVLFCLVAMSSFGQVTWIEQGVLWILAGIFMAVVVASPIMSLVWIKQKSAEKRFVRTRLTLLLLTTGPFVALVLTQLLGMFFTSSVSNVVDSLAYMRTISVIVSSIVATGTLAYTAGIFGITGLSVVTYLRKTSKHR